MTGARKPKIDKERVLRSFSFWVSRTTEGKVLSFLPAQYPDCGPRIYFKAKTVPTVHELYVGFKDAKRGVMTGERFFATPLDRKIRSPEKRGFTAFSVCVHMDVFNFARDTILGKRAMELSFVLNDNLGNMPALEMTGDFGSLEEFVLSEEIANG